ncbi:J domain-containing protein [Dethiosulfatarculus sandiegensis]|uniref:J domain-containing protein n=1 Tax=Dethiosulfatarculus sandiegensis TaxID=1429043 RepID=UPI0012E19D4D|nr:J domain-containing protein [Dethiosulfatarculus sandiegensis]
MASTKKEINDACGILFGPEVEVSVDFLNYLQPSGLKAAYRKRALESHPDRARVLGVSEDRMVEQFKQVLWAYEKLCSVVMGDEVFRENIKSEHHTAGSRNGSARPTYGDQPHYYQGPIPGRRLRIAEFLYYSGNIPWHLFIKAITWQRMQRPTIGRLALEVGVLSEFEVQRILKNRRIGEKFGECAIRLGYLTQFRLSALLGRQAMLQPRIGSYFVENGILAKSFLHNMLFKLKMHNQKVH